MIIKTYPNKNLYGKYFLATEAPSDEVVTTEQPKPRRNVKVISVKPSNRYKDFTDINQEDEEEPKTQDNEQTDTSDKNESDVQDTQPEENLPEEQNTSPVVDGDNTNNEQPDDQPDTGEEDNTDFAGETEPNEESEENPETGDVDAEETGEEGPDVGGEDDFTASVDEGNPEEPSVDSGEQPTQNTNEVKSNAPGVEFDSTRKYNLFKEYMSLYNATDNYISKLENVLKNDYEENQIIRISVNNLREIKDILFDYMTIRFQLNSYIQSLLFYQKMVVAVQLVFNLLKSISNKSNK